VGYPSIYNPRNATVVNATLGGTTPGTNYYFNPNAFGLEAIGTLGNEGRNNFHGPGINNTDLVLAKDFRWTEVRRIELRLEAFNVFNHTQFGLISAASPIFYENIQASNFGQTLTANPGRVVQLGAKIYF
jgi:hypothetical protein